MPKKSSSSFLNQKRRRKQKAPKSFNLYTNFFSPILKPIASNINDIIISQQSPISIPLPLDSKEQIAMIKNDYHSYSPKVLQLNANGNCTYSQTEDSLYVSSFDNLPESELESLILNQILTPTMISHESEEEDCIDSDIYRYKPFLNHFNGELAVQGVKLLNEVKFVLCRLDSYNFSLGHLFRSSSQSYAIITSEMKDLLIELTNHFDINFLSQTFNISKKSIVRWRLKGTIRKKGAGRKTSDPEMEARVFKWYNDNRHKIRITSQMIKQKAIQYSKVKSFQASKGWFDKYRKKYNIVTQNHK